MEKIEQIKSLIVEVDNFPKQGISFKDITPLFLQPNLVKDTIDEMSNMVKHMDFDVIVSPESRGYLFGVQLSLLLNKPFVFVRKKGKLPRPTVCVSYNLEYGSAELEISKDDIKPNQKVLIVDDILATGGTIHAIESLLKKLSAKIIGSIFLAELINLNGKKGLSGIVQSLIKYEI